MINKYITIALSALSLPSLAYSAVLTQSDITGYWAYCQGPMSTKTNISTDYSSIADDYMAGTIPHPTDWDVSVNGSEVIGKELNWGMTPILVGSVENANYMVAIYGTQHLAGIYNGPTTGLNGDFSTSSGNAWQFYDGGNNGIFTVDNITSSLNCNNTMNSRNSIVIRKRATGTNFSVGVDNIYISEGACVSLGEGGTGTFLSSVTLGDSVAGGVIKVGGVSTSQYGTLEIRASNLTSYVTNIDLDFGRVHIYKGISNSTEEYTDCNADFSAANLNVTGTSKWVYGTSSSVFSGNLTLGDITVTGSSSSLTFDSYTTGNTTLGKISNAGYNSNFTIKGANFSAGDIDFSDRGTLYIGTADSVGGGMTNVILGSKINLTSSDTNYSKMMVVTENFSTTAPITELTLNNGYVQFLGSAYDNGSATAYKSYDLDLSHATLTLAGKNYFQYGKQWNITMDATLTFGDIVLASSDINSELAVYTSKNIINANSIQTTEKGVAGSKLFWKFGNRQLHVANNAEIAVESFQLYAQLHVAGNYLNSFEADSFLRYQTDGNGAMYVSGTFETLGNFVVGIGDAVQTVNRDVMSVGGIVGATPGSKIISAYNYAAYAGNTGSSNININGVSGSYSTTTSIVDFASDADPVTLAQTGALCINKSGASVQFLRGNNMYRGLTTVSEGQLYIRADGTGNAAGWGIGAVQLSGGKFGGIGEVSNISNLVVDSISFTGGQLAIDINGSDFDSVSFKSLTAPIVAESADLINFEFNLTDVIADTNYKIMDWDSSLGALGFDLKDVTYTINGAEGLSAVFSYAAGGDGMNVMFTAIPEPATYAALFGALALGLAAWRKRK